MTLPLRPSRKPPVHRESRLADGLLPAISLFSGLGGLDLGVRRAGFDVRAAVEWEPDAAASLRANHFSSEPERIVQRSLTDLSTSELLERAGLPVGGAALVVGGPPCTPFSKSGYWLEYKRKGLDPDATLLDDFARVVREAKPEVALLENVHGLAYRNHNAGPLGRLVTQLQAAGYGVAYQVLNAADYGVPQLRKRLFLYAVKGRNPPSFPSPAHSGWTETKRTFDSSLLPYVTSRDVIGSLSACQNPTEPEEHVNGYYGDLLPLIPAGENYLHFTAERGHSNPIFEWRSRYWTFLLKLDPERPSTTIQAQPGPYVGPFHWDNRRLRLLEVKRLQTFPDDYIIVGSRRSAQVQLGNAVPPLLAAQVAEPLVNVVNGRAAE